MNLEMVKNFMKEVGWGFLATSDGNKVAVRPMGSCVWMDNELWAATTDGTEKVLQLRKVPYAEYCFSDREGKHIRIAGSCTISTNNNDKGSFRAMMALLRVAGRSTSQERRNTLKMQRVFRKLGDPRSLINAAPKTLPYRNEREIENLFTRLDIPIKQFRAFASCWVVRI